MPRDDRCAPNTVNECSDVASPAVSLPVPTLDGWLAGCGVDAVELPAKTKTEKKVVAAPIAAAMGSESDAMLRQSDEDALGAVRRDDCSTMDTASGAKTKTEKNVS